jgi:creatinine amidohydrolase
VIGNPLTATAEKGEEALERFSDHLVRAIDEFRGLDVQVSRRAFEDRV